MSYLVQIDQSGAEALIVAYLTKHGNFRELFLNNIKPHVFVAMHLVPEYWSEQMHEDILPFLKSSVRGLRNVPRWKELEKLIKDSDNSKYPSKRYYHIGKTVCHACLSPDHEVLTPLGWRSIADKPDTIAIYNAQTQDITFETIRLFHEFDYTGELLHFRSDTVDQLVTPNHRVLYLNGTGKLMTSDACELEGTKTARIPTTGKYVGGTANITNLQAKLVAALQADGSIRHRDYVLFSFKKARKIERLRSLLIEGKYSYREGTDGEYTWFGVHNLHDIVDIFKGNKQYDSWLLTWPREAIDTLLRELTWWDGDYAMRHIRRRYFTNSFQNAQWIQTLKHLSMGRSTINTVTREFSVNLGDAQYSRLSYKVHAQQYSGKVYCPTVSTGYFLIRRKGKISITGNSNYDMKAPTMQMQALDKSEGELRLTYEFCKHSLELYKLRLFPEIPAWHIEIQDELRYNKKILRNLFGYPREFNKTLGEDMYKEAYAYKPQSTVGTITNIAATEIQSGIDNGDYNRVDVLNNNHDSLLLQLRYSYDECLKLIPLLQAHFNRQLTSPRGEIFYMKSSASIGRNWAPYDEKDNPEGLKEI